MHASYADVVVEIDEPLPAPYSYQGRYSGVFANRSAARQRVTVTLITWALPPCESLAK